MDSTAVGSQCPLLEMVKITKLFPGVTALSRVDFDLQRGEVHALVGENGAGKSTLMKILSGAYQPHQGEIRIDGKPVRIRNPRQAQEYGISIIYQEFTLIPQLSVAANIFLGREPVRYPGWVNHRLIRRQTTQMLRDLELELDPDMPVKQLNVPQQQMVEIAKALVSDTRIFIMDEPTSALTGQEMEILFALIHRIRQRGVGIIYITHRLEEISRISDRVTILRDGQTVGCYASEELDKRQLIRLMVNRDVKEYYPRVRTPRENSVLQVEQLTRGNRIRDISFELKSGEILGIAGLLGAGRTELARVLFGIDRPDRGTIRIQGREVTITSPRSAIAAGIGFLTEDRKQLGLVLSLSVKDNISLPNLDQFSARGFLRSGKIMQLSRRFIRELRIKTPDVHQKVLYLSGGNQQKVVLSKWLARQLAILIFDEPTRGIDVAAKVEIYEFMNQLTAQGVGIIMISSELTEILGMSDRILVMHNGKISGEFDARTATQEAILAIALGEVA